jgi:uncharacterized protein YggT (Ycf19 family)
LDRGGFLWEFHSIFKDVLWSVLGRILMSFLGSIFGPFRVPNLPVSLGFLDLRPLFWALFWSGFGHFWSVFGHFWSTSGIGVLVTSGPQFALDPLLNHFWNRNLGHFGTAAYLVVFEITIGLYL